MSDYLSNHSQINIEGFLNFRLQEYNAFLSDSLENLTEEYLIEKEYEEFISLLSYFVEIQEPLIDQVHILPFGEERYRLFDGNGVEVTNFCIREFLGEFGEENIHFDDFLLSTLISLAPQKVVLHHPEEVMKRNVIQTIQKVFGDQLSFCSACDLCYPELKSLRIYH